MKKIPNQSLARTVSAFCNGYFLFYFNSNNYKHTVTLTRNLLEAAFCGLFFFVKKAYRKNAVCLIKFVSRGFPVLR